MSAAAKYHPRAPRYVFRAGDQTLLRFAGMERKGEPSRARIRDVSASGLSFLVDYREAHRLPPVGTMLKVEFSVPGRKQIAWFATVVRIEAKGEWDDEESEGVAVALKFRKLPAAFVRAIEVVLKEKGTGDPDDGVVELIDAQGAARLFLVSLALVAVLAITALPPSMWLRILKF